MKIYQPTKWRLRFEFSSSKMFSYTLIFFCNSLAIWNPAFKVYFLTSASKFMQAEQKAREESERLRQQEREQIVEKRKRDLVCFSHYYLSLIACFLWAENLLFQSFYLLSCLPIQTLRARIAAKAEEKRMELLFLKWSEHKKKLGNFIRYCNT